MEYRTRKGDKIEILYPEVRNAFISWYDVQLNMKDGSKIRLKRDDFDWATWVGLVTDIKKFFGVEEKF